jgi:hypothetical protein
MDEYVKTQPIAVAVQQWYEYASWKLRREKPGEKRGAAHLYKQKTVADYGHRYELPILVETGTYLGAMVYAMRNNFKRIYSVELSHRLATSAEARFRRFPHVTILKGNSASVLPQLLPSLREPVLFWLDGHYSEGITARADQDSPVISEVTTILRQMNQRFAILIDDARFFIGKNGYPTLLELQESVTRSKPGMQILIDSDIIRIFATQ